VKVSKYLALSWALNPNLTNPSKSVYRPRYPGCRKLDTDVSYCNVD